MKAGNGSGVAFVGGNQSRRFPPAPLEPPSAMPTPATPLPFPLSASEESNLSR